MVCIHGITSRGRRFAELAESKLAARFRTVAFDLRGHGDSGFDPPWNLQTHVDDVLETATSLGIERAAWIGHSFGGRVVYEVASRSPERVKRVALLDPAFDLDPEECRKWAERVRGDDESWESLEVAEVNWARDNPRAPRERLRRTVERLLTERDDGRWHREYLRSAVVAIVGELARPLPPPADVPTLLVVAEGSDLVTDRHREQLAERLGNRLDAIDVPGGHGVLTEAFDETAGAILRFLARSSSLEDARA